MSGQLPGVQMTTQPRSRNKMPLHLDSLDSSSLSSPTNRSKVRSPGRGRGISELLRQELERFANSQETFILAAMNLQQQQIFSHLEKLVLQVGPHDLHDGTGQATRQMPVPQEAAPAAGKKALAKQTGEDSKSEAPPALNSQRQAEASLASFAVDEGPPGSQEDSKSETAPASNLPWQRTYESLESEASPAISAVPKGPPGEREDSKSQTTTFGAEPEPPNVASPALHLPGQATSEAEAVADNEPKQVDNSRSVTGAPSNHGDTHTHKNSRKHAAGGRESLSEDEFQKDTTSMLKEIKRFQNRGRRSTLPEIDGLASCRNIVSSSIFEAAIAVFLAADALVLGLEANSQISDPQNPVPSWMEISNTIFFVVFLLELCLRINAQRCDYLSCQNPQLSWNIFDIVVVGSGCVERILNLFSWGALDASALRVIRLTRITRGMRIVRVVHMFQDLRVMVQGCLSSIQPLFWGLCLLAMMMYVFAIVILQEALAEITVQPGNGGVLTAAELMSFKNYFGSLERAMYTLFKSITGGEDWGNAAEPLLRMRPFLGALYCLYISVATLCVLNIINGVFVDNAKKMVALDEEMVMMEQLDQRNRWYSEVKELFSIAGDGSGMLDCEAFTEKLKDYRLQAWLRKVGVHVESHSAAGFFQLIDVNGDGLLDMDEFARALQQVHGQARSVDLARVHAECRAVKKDLQNLCTVVQAAFVHLAPQVDTSQLTFGEGTVWCEGALCGD
eukprot:TRINITY_DN11147_c0_g2_i1.p1 TRINITY_DN11147_c0_g2~~TRINITY_DN11147_c0_g2_i1.p1  ORF type:complete len:750 (-),score=135.67 TRINITY_DN11147_c0_g2_i1:32-2230(-)